MMDLKLFHRLADSHVTDDDSLAVCWLNNWTSSIVLDSDFVVVAADDVVVLDHLGDVMVL